MVSRLLITNILKQRGHSVLTAKDGLEAIDLFSRNAIDMILMDVSMPNMSGLEAATAIRKKESPGIRIPILALTANVLDGDRERCLHAGMDDYISKPIRSKELLARIAEMAYAAKDRSVTR
jgi:CheY-like chemotaxis protein